MTAPLVIIERDAFGVRFDVRVEHAPDGWDGDRDFTSYREARGYAGGLRLVRRWPIEDRCTEAAA